MAHESGIKPMNSSGKPSFSDVLPPLLLGLWLAYLAVTIWQHAAASVQPPWGDGLSYLQKAASFWGAVAQGGSFNPFNLFPSVRPPGTVLMSYPFGLTTDFHGYHFRSVFLPILSVAIAVYVAAGWTHVRRDGWTLAATAFLLTSLPMFYWFDWNDSRWINNGWGMVDNFQAGVAALAGAALVRSLASRSQGWLLVASLLACLTFLIKQSGLMVMGLLGLAWMTAVIFEWRLTSRAAPARLRAYAAKGAAQLFVVYGAVIAWSATSDYFSPSNFAYAMKALNYYREIAPPPSLVLFHSASGEAAVLWVLGVGALFIHGRSWVTADDRVNSAKALGLLVGSLVIWTLGVWYWIVIQTGGTQIRYFYPFMLMGAICLIPAAMHAWPRSNGWIRWPLFLLCFAPALNIALLLASGNSPSHAWQQLSGVSVAVGLHREEVDRANALLAEIRRSKKDARVYFFPSSAPPQTFVFLGAYEKIVRPTLPSFIPINPMDWSRGFVVRTGELIESDYIVTRKFEDLDPARRFAAATFSSYDAESNAFDAWLSTLDRESGVETATETAALRVLRVINRDALALAVKEFVAAHAWRKEFIAANQPAPPAWWNGDMVTTSAIKLSAEAIGFNDVYKLHALSLEEIDNGIKVTVWWEEIRHERPNDERYLFLHLVDATSAILFIHQIALFPYLPPSADRKWRHGSATFIDVLPNAKIAALAFGIYQPSQPDGGFLLSNGARTDWGGKRTLTPFPPARVAEGSRKLPAQK